MSGRIPRRTMSRNTTLPPRSGLMTLIIAFVIMLSTLPLASNGVLAQDDAEVTPDPALPTDNAQDEDEGTPDAATDEEPAADDDPPAEDGDDEGSDTTPSSTDSGPGTEEGNPVVLAQGLSFLSGDTVAWQVREVDLPRPADAESQSFESVLVLQRDGETIIRNDLTAKRSRLEAGEGYFIAAADPYTMTAESRSSTVWMFEVVPTSDVAADALYESPQIEDYDEGTYDMELIRYVLQPGQTAELPAHTGPALLMSTSGEIEFEDEGGLGLLVGGQGQLIPGEGTVSNATTEPAEYVFAAYGESVDETTSAAPQATDDAATDETTTDDTTADEAVDDVVEEPADDTSDSLLDDTAEPPADDGTSGDGTFVTTINITAEIDLYVTVVADGVTVFDGTLPAGGSTGAIAGSTFEVYTSSGVNTTFTDGCGASFLMGYEEGEATYTLAADENSC